MNINKWIKENTTNLKGKTIVITGASGDLGRETCRILALLGANLIFLNRSEKKSSLLKEEILKINPSCSVNYLIVDFQDFNSVLDVSKKLNQYDVDILIINAGAYKIERRISDIGYDNIFQINCLSPYFLIKETLMKMRKRKKGKIIMVSSIAYNYSCLNEEDIDFKKVKKDSLAYGNSKRFLMYSLFELFKEEKDIELSIVHPGITYTNITSHFPKFIYFFIKYGMRFVFISNKKAVLNMIYGVFNKCDYGYWIGPKYFNIWGYPKYKRLKKYDINESEKMYKISEEIYFKCKNNN